MATGKDYKRLDFLIILVVKLSRNSRSIRCFLEQRCHNSSLYTLLANTWLATKELGKRCQVLFRKTNKVG